MKHFSKLIALAMSLVMFGFFGCSDISDDNKAMVTTGIVTDKEESKTIILEAEADDDVIIFPSASDSDSRTILPDAVDSSTLHFYLVYRDIINSSTASIEEVTFNKDAGVTAYTKGTITKSFTLSNYTFTLYAVTAEIYAKVGTFTTSNIATNASYVGYANADLRYKDVVTFHLKPNTSSSGKGRVELTISNVDNWSIPANYVVYAGLYKIEDEYTDTAVYPTTGKKEIYTLNTTETGTLDPVNKSVIKSAAATYDVPAGEYNLIIAYCYQPETAGVTKKAYEYSEKVIVLMNEETIAEVNVPDILEKAPAAPTNFTVAYQNPATIETEYYPVQFMWSDNSSTEREFELQILEITDEDAYIAMPTDNTKWEALVSSGTVIPYTKLAMQNSSYYISGTLNKNSNYVTMYFPLGARFEARLCAKNDAGSSDYAYAEWAKIDTKYKNAADIEETTARYVKTTAPSGTSSATNDVWTVFPADVTTINRFRITYDLNGGKFFNNAPTPAALAKEPALVHYASQYTKDAATTPTASETVNVILTPDGITEQKWFTDLAGLVETDTKAALTLADDGNYWDKWLVDSDSGTTYPQTVTYFSYDQNETNKLSSTAFIGNIKYYPYNVTDDTVAASTALGSQPTLTGWAAGKYTLSSVSSTHSDYKTDTNPPTYWEFYRVRKAVSQLYTGYKNLTLVAHYDTTKVLSVVVEDISVYELNPAALTLAFAKSGAPVTTAINVAGTTGDAVTDVGFVNTVNTATGTAPANGLGGVLEVSLSLVNQITFTVDTDVAKFPVLSYDEATNTISSTDGTYDNVHLKISKIGSPKTPVDKDWDSTGKNWTVAFSSWTEGNYLVEFTATTSQMPNYIYSATTVIKITD
ncbi:hypothetical protein [Treponema sp.]|uniref:hypothetical protein n=1 Tax=Treponema sp. TaxID=166 RepID=UPI0025FCC9DA|nr:hypothetical protein [Treponema sp.]MBR4322458.1 hypothetical protein [Treponema sp.]